MFFHVVIHTFTSNSPPKCFDFSEHQKYTTWPPGIFIRKDRPELSAGISSTVTKDWDLLLKVNNLSFSPLSPMNERRRSDVGKTVRFRFPLQQWRGENDLGTLNREITGNTTPDKVNSRPYNVLSELLSRANENTVHNYIYV